MDFNKLTYSKQEQEARIAWKLTSQDKHINYLSDDRDITYVSSVWMKTIDVLRTQMKEIML